MPRLSLVVACLALPAVLAGFAGCSDGDNGGEPTVVTAQPTATLAPTAVSDTPTPAPDIRQDDLRLEPGLSDYLARSGGVVSDDAISYADVTGDGIEDAVIPISSGGEGGNIAMFVYSYQPAGLTELLRVTTDTSLTVALLDGGIQVTEAAYGPGDPLCCPSGLDVTAYRWDGSTFVAEEQAP